MGYAALYWPDLRYCERRGGIVVRSNAEIGLRLQAFRAVSASADCCGQEYLPAHTTIPTVVH